MRTYYEFNFSLFSIEWNNDGQFFLNICDWTTADHEGELLYIGRSASWDFDFLCIRQLWLKWKDV